MLTARLGRPAWSIGEKSPLGRTLRLSAQYWRATNSRNPYGAFSKARGDAALRRDLIERIHWDCGKPDFSTLRQELEARLVVVGRDRFNLPAPEARRLADPLVYRVLEKSIVNTPQERVLTRADLYDAIDAATRTSVPRASVDDLARLASALAGSLGGGLGTGNPFPLQKQAGLLTARRFPLRRG